MYYLDLCIHKYDVVYFQINVLNYQLRLGFKRFSLSGTAQNEERSKTQTGILKLPSRVAASSLAPSFLVGITLTAAVCHSGKKLRSTLTGYL